MTLLLNAYGGKLLWLQVSVIASYSDPQRWRRRIPGKSLLLTHWYFPGCPEREWIWAVFLTSVLPFSLRSSEQHTAGDLSHPNPVEKKIGITINSTVMKFQQIHLCIFYTVHLLYQDAHYASENPARGFIKFLSNYVATGVLMMQPSDWWWLSSPGLSPSSATISIEHGTFGRRIRCTIIATLSLPECCSWYIESHLPGADFFKPYGGRWSCCRIGSNQSPADESREQDAGINSRSQGGGMWDSLAFGSHGRKGIALPQGNHHKSLSCCSGKWWRPELPAPPPTNPLGTKGFCQLGFRKDTMDLCKETNSHQKEWQLRLTPAGLDFNSWGCTILPWPNLEGMRSPGGTPFLIFTLNCKHMALRCLLMTSRASYGSWVGSAVERKEATFSLGRSLYCARKPPSSGATHLYISNALGGQDGTWMGGIGCCLHSLLVSSMKHSPTCWQKAVVLVALLLIQAGLLCNPTHVRGK